MNDNQGLYTLTEAEIVYHTPEQDYTKSHRMNLHKR